MESIIIYEKDTGRVTGTCSNSDWLESEQLIAAEQSIPTVAVIVETKEIINTCLLWFMAPNETLHKRTAFPELQVNGGVIEGIPDHTRVTWPDQVKTIESGTIEFDSNVQGDFTFIFDAPAYIPQTLTVTL